jgi:biotin carboxylase
MDRDFQRLAIIHRGQAAMRLIYGVREWNRERKTAIRSVALYTDPDHDAPFVHEADEAYALGPSSFVDPRDGRRKSAYLDRDRARRVLEAARVDAAWVGWGFVPEQVEFADLCRSMGILFLGPDPAVMRRLDDKVAVKRLAEELGLAVVPWRGPIESVDDAIETARALGFPVVVKAARGGAARGVRVARDEAELEEVFGRVRAEARGAFKDASVLIERHLARARQIDVQCMADAHGTVWALGVRDASVQRRGKRLVDECPPAFLGAEREAEARRAATDLLRAASFEGAATVELLVEDGGRPLLLEVNPRLTIEHAVVEATTGVDVVKLQLAVARGERLEGDVPAPIATPSRCASRRRIRRAISRRRPVSSSASARRWAPVCGSTPRSARAARCRRSSTR